MSESNKEERETRKTLVIPPALHKKLKKQAIDNGNTLQKETCELLKNALNEK